VRFDTKIRFDFVNNRKKFFIGSIALTLVGIISLLLMSMNFGVDFKAGTNMDIAVGKQLSQQEANQIFESVGISSATTTIGGAGDRVSARFNDVLAQNQITSIQNAFKEKYGDDVSTEVNVVTPDMAKEMGINSIYAVLIASVAMMLYVIIRFDWRSAVAANVAILYDAFVVIAIFSIFRLEVDLTFIAAVLTTIGYSINDKIVILDRIRENLRFGQYKNNEQLASLVNQSVWQTMARNIYTVLAVVIIAVALLVLGSESIRLFSLAMLIGLISGAYSSICITSPLWYVLKSKEKRKSAVKPTTSAS